MGAQKTNEVSWETPKMLGWKKMSTERIFYYNRVTGALLYSTVFSHGD